MKAVLITRTGDPSVLDYVEVPTPRPKTGEVLVKADTIGVNCRWDTARREVRRRPRRMAGIFVVPPV